jgi:hypothetical protein
MPLFLLSLFGWGKSALDAVLTFFSRPPGVYIGLALACAGGLWWFGQHEFNRGMAHQIALEQAAGQKLAGRQVKIVHDLQVKYLPAEARIVTVTKTITKEIPKYVTVHDDAACPIPRGFVRLHDAAAEGTIPSGPTGTDADPSGVKLSAVASTVTENYGTCHLAFSRLCEWQDWYRQQSAAWNEANK